MKSPIRLVIGAMILNSTAHAAELHVAQGGDDRNPGTAAAPLRTIQRAAELARPGDVITVHEGIYRERVHPPRGGESDERRIVYQAAPGEIVEIRGSEVIKGWEHVQNDTWKVTLPASFFGDFNPYRDVIRGDWFDPRGRVHHTGAVYLDGQWLIEATSLEEVLAPVEDRPAWLGGTSQGYLFNLAWWQLGDGSSAEGRQAVTRTAARSGARVAPSDEGGDCLGFIEHGHWVRYDDVDFGAGASELALRAASEADGGVVEIRLDGPRGELIGRCVIPNTGGWQSWATFAAPIKPVTGVRSLCLVFTNPPNEALDAPLWFAQAEDDSTTIWAQFKGVDPNERTVEINVRRTVFYPDAPGRNYITVRGFRLRHAATPWAPPTAEQIGLLGSHWSKGWIIEDNEISHSVCAGISLGKYGDAFDNTSANTAEGYVKTIERALQNGWNRETVGHHVVRNNRIHHCEQAGIVGSLGAIFSEISGNEIHDVHMRRLFSGAEMAGIKIHAAIDVRIAKNHIHRTCLGLWLDWMAQGTRVTGNLFHDNRVDLFVEVNHGPFLVDNNLFLSAAALQDWSQGGAYVHNLFAGSLVQRPELGRQTPYHPPHETAIAGLRPIDGGDDRFINNVFVGRSGLAAYDAAALPMMTEGNAFVGQARPSRHEGNPTLVPQVEAKLELTREADGVYLDMDLGEALAAGGPRALVTTARLGKTHVAGLPYDRPDGSPISIDADYLGKTRNPSGTAPGPLEVKQAGKVKVW